MRWAGFSMISKRFENLHPRESSLQCSAAEWAREANMASKVLPGKSREEGKGRCLLVEETKMAKHTMVLSRICASITQQIFLESTESRSNHLKFTSLT